MRYDGGVDWGGEPVTFVVGIAGKGDEHLEILSQIAILFSDEDEVAEAEGGVEPPEELFASCVGGQTSMKAVHFGAGNIGRGFVGLLLHEGGYELVFSDVAAPLVDAINAVSEYTVHEVGEGGGDRVVTGFRAINSATHADELIEEIAGANVVTTAVGPTILRFVAPHIVRGTRAARSVARRRCRSWRARTRSTPPTCCATRSPSSPAMRGMPSPAARCSPTPPSTGSCPAQPAGRRRRRHGRAVLRVGDRAAAVRR